MLIARPRRRIHQQPIQHAPLHILQKLLDEPILLWAPPDDRIILPRQHKLYAHDAQVVRNIDGAPPGAAGVYALAERAHHARDARPANVNVAHAHLRAGRLRKGVREHGREGGLADAALAGDDEQLVRDGGHACVDEGQVWVRAFGRRGADLLVGAAGAGVAFAGEIGGGAGAVFYGC